MLNAFRRLFSNSHNRKARRVFGLPRPELLSLEQRINPATFTYDSVSEALTIDLNTTNEVLTLTSSGIGNYVFTSTSNFTGTNTTGLTGNGTKTLTITSALVLNDVAITDSFAGTDVKFGANSGAYVDNFSITLDEAGESVVTVANATAFSGAAGLNVAAARNIVISANLSTATGDIVLDADNGGQKTGNFVGVNISGSGVDVATTGGNITIAGRGGDDSTSNEFGVYVQNGAKVQAGDNGSIFGTVSVTGTGGAAGGGGNHGVRVDGAGSKITSSGGSVTVIGTGGGTSATTSNDNYGVELSNGGEISAGGIGTVSVTGTGGAAGGGENYGVNVKDSGSKITSSGGSVTVTGTGGAAGGIRNYGVFVKDSGSIITSSGGSVTIIGNGGGTSATTSRENSGLLVANGGVISAGDNGSIFGNVSVTGTGGAAGGNFNYGVNVDGANSIITSSGGSVTVIGIGGGTGASNFNIGFNIFSSGEISAGGTGTVSVTGTGGVGASSTGIDLLTGTITTNTSGAAVTLTADSMAFDATSIVSSTGTVTLQNKTAGVAIDLGTEITGQLSLTDTELDRVTAGTLVIGRDDAFLSGTITVSSAISRAAGNLTLLGRNILVTADLSTTTGDIVLDADNSVQQIGNFIGVKISGTGVDVTTGGGNITIAGRGGDDINDNQFGVYVQNGAQVQAGDNGSIFGAVSVTGTGGAAGGDFNYGVNVEDANSIITSSGGSVTVIGIGGGTGTSGNNRGLEVDNGGKISAGGTGTVSVTGTGGAAGGDFNYGVNVNSAGSIITSSGGSVTIIGIGGGTGTSGNNRGVEVDNGGKISAGANGSIFGIVSVTGTGGAAGGNFNHGVKVDNANSIITSSGGSVTIIGIGGGTGASSSSNRGIYIVDSGEISAGGTGTVSVTGTGGAAAGGDLNHGIRVENIGSIITSSGGNVTVTGTGGGTGASSDNRGVHVLNSGEISAGGTGTVSVTGTGGAGSSTGINLATSAATITTNSSGAAITLTADSISFNTTLAVISSTGTVTLQNKTAGVAINLGTETAGQLSLTDAELDRVTAGTLVIGRSGVNPGVITVSNALTLPSTVSALQFIGPAGITLNNNVTTIGSQTYTGAVTLGANVALATTNSNILFSSTINGAQSLGLTAGAGTVTFTDTVGNSTELSALTISSAADVSIGAAMKVTGAIGITSDSGVNVSLGSATGGLNLSNSELALITAAGSLNITAAGAGTMTVNAVSGGGTISGITTLTAGGTGVTFATAASLFNNALTVASAAILNTNVSTSDDAINFAAVSLTANSTLNAGSGNILLPGTISNFGAGTFSLTPITSGAGLTTISGANTNTTTFVTTGVVKINNTTASTTNFDVSGGTLKGTGSIGNLTGTGTGIIAPGNSPGQVTTTNLNLSSGNTLQIEIQGASASPSAGTDYDQIVVSSGGTVILGSATLSLSSTFTGSVGTVFTIIDNQGSNPVSGTFSGLADGAVFTANGRDYQISYSGGNGSNDVTLTVNPPTVTSNNANLAINATTLTIAGTGFDTVGSNTVTFNNGAVGNVTSATTTLLTVNLTTPPSTIGSLTAIVTSFGGTSGSAVQVANIVAAPTPTPTAPLITGTPTPPSSSGSSTVNLYNPATGQPTGSAVPFPGFSGPVKVASGDFNNDGVAELVAGAGFGGGPAIAILNSQTGEVMQSFFAFDQAFTGGVFVAVQDTNGDGILDIIAAAGPGGGPEVRIFNGANLNLLRSFYAYAEDFSGGVSVASIDFNNDGILDLVTGAGPGGAPHVKVYDGATNAIISQWYAYPVTFTGGVFVAVGDIGNDGTFEVVTGAGQGGSPVVAVWDPFTGALLSQFYAYAEDFTGGARVAINDGNGDGIADILTGAGPSGGPHVKAFSFPALDILFQFYSGESTDPGGVFVS